MKKKEVLKLALMGLAVGSTMCGCSNSKSQMGDMQNSDQGSCSGKTTCKGKSGCTGKSDCTGHTGCKGKSGCTGKSDCTGRSSCKGKTSAKGGMQSDASEALKEKREVVAEELNNR